MSFGFALASALFAILSLGGAMLSLKLYTEFVKEKKYREP